MDAAGATVRGRTVECSVSHGKDAVVKILRLDWHAGAGRKPRLLEACIFRLQDV